MIRAALSLLCLVVVLLHTSWGHAALSGPGVVHPRGWLQDVTAAGSTTSYAYDGNGNRKDASAVHDLRDRLKSHGSKTYAFRPSGDLLAVTDTAQNTSTKFSYDALGQLRRVELPDSTTVRYRYDALGRRVERSKGGVTTDRFVYRSALPPLLWTDERVSPAVSSRFVYVRDRNVPDYMIQGSRQFWLVTDQVGSVRLVVDMNATPAKIVQRIDYDAGGNVLRDELYDATVRPVPFRFAGGLWDEDTRLVHFGTRDYDPETGRWTSRDPLLFGGGDSNLYVYAGNDPVNRSDPSGEMAPLAVLGLLYGGAALVLGFGMSAPSDTGAEGAEADLLGMLLSGNAAHFSKDLTSTLTWAWSWAATATWTGTAHLDDRNTLARMARDLVALRAIGAGPPRRRQRLPPRQHPRSRLRRRADCQRSDHVVWGTSTWQPLRVAFSSSCSS